MADKILLAHGGGGSLMRELLTNIIGPALGGDVEMELDAAPIPVSEKDFLSREAPVGDLENNAYPRCRLAMTTDAFVVSPIFFPGGDIGELAVCGTINDLAVSGAEPLVMSMTLILEEGLPIDDLKKILCSVRDALTTCNVKMITGDTKVVPRGKADQIFITTTGIGRYHTRTAPSNIRVGDSILINGSIAQHGVAVMAAREGASFLTDVETDTQPLWPLVKALLDANIEIHEMRDPTRGGVAACCNELGEASSTTFLLHEAALPVTDPVRGACDMLGLDPLTVANEGKLLLVIPESDADKALEVLQRMTDGEACRIGEVIEAKNKPALLKTTYGGERIIDMPYGEDLPRIC